MSGFYAFFATVMQMLMTVIILKKYLSVAEWFYAFSFWNFSMNSTSFCTPSIGIAL